MDWQHCDLKRLPAALHRLQRDLWPELVEAGNPSLLYIGDDPRPAYHVRAFDDTSPLSTLDNNIALTPERWGYTEVPTLPSTEGSPLMQAVTYGAPATTPSEHRLALQKSGVSLARISGVCYAALQYDADMRSTVHAILGIIEDLYCAVVEGDAE